MAKNIIACFLALVLVASLAVTVGSAPANDSDIVEFTYYDKGGVPHTPPSGDDAADSYKILGKGVKWDLSDYPGGVSYEINTTGAPTGSMAEIVAAFETWDAKTSAELFNYAGITTSSDVHQDFQNTISWASISESGVIAQCSFWYSRSKKTMIEFDIVFNTAMNWGIGEDVNFFDVRNIATHEIGHTLVLLDLYEDSNSEMTMYGYGSLGETKKISLEDGDIAGLQKLYGA